MGAAHCAGARNIVDVDAKESAPAMPQRGLCLSCSDDDLAAAVDYMIEEGQ